MCSSTVLLKLSFRRKYLSIYSVTCCSENPVTSAIRSNSILLSLSDSSDLDVIMIIACFKIFFPIRLAQSAAISSFSVQSNSDILHGSHRQYNLVLD